MQYFGSKIVEGVAESWVEAKMSWVEVDGAGWRWVHGLVIPLLKNNVLQQAFPSLKFGINILNVLPSLNPYNFLSIRHVVQCNV